MVEKPEFLQINLSRKLEELGWSYKKFSSKSGVSYHTIFRAVSKGVIPRGENLRKMATALETTVAELLADPNAVPKQVIQPLTAADLAQSEERILKALKSTTRGYHLDPPPELGENWPKLDVTRQMMILYLATKEDRYKRILGQTIVSRIEAISRYALEARSKEKKAR